MPYLLVKTSRVYYGGGPQCFGDNNESLVADTLEEAIALSLAQYNPIGYDVYLQEEFVPPKQHGTDPAKVPVWKRYNSDRKTPW